MVAFICFYLFEMQKDEVEREEKEIVERGTFPSIESLPKCLYHLGLRPFKARSVEIHPISLVWVAGTKELRFHLPPGLHISRKLHRKQSNQGLRPNSARGSQSSQAMSHAAPARHLLLS